MGAPFPHRRGPSPWLALIGAVPGGLGLLGLIGLSSQKPVVQVGGIWLDSDGKESIGPGTYHGLQAACWVLMAIGLVVVVVVLAMQRRSGPPAYQAPMGVAVQPAPFAAPVNPSPPAGWHSDPWVPGQWRWWSGAAWSEHTRALNDPQFPPPHSRPGPPSSSS